MRERAVWVDLHPDTRNVAVNVGIEVDVERIKAVGNEQLMIGKIVDRELSVAKLRDRRGLICFERPIVVEGVEEIDSDPVCQDEEQDY